MYSIWDGVDTLVALEELAQDFVDQTTFMEYFKASWLPKIGSISLSKTHKCTCKDMHTLIQDTLCEVALNFLHVTFVCSLSNRNVAFNNRNCSTC